MLRPSGCLKIVHRSNINKFKKSNLFFYFFIFFQPLTNYKVLVNYWKKCPPPSSNNGTTTPTPFIYPTSTPGNQGKGERELAYQALNGLWTRYLSMYIFPFGSWIFSIFHSSLHRFLPSFEFSYSLCPSLFNTRPFYFFFC